jgi:hypothetical protein
MMFEPWSSTIYGELIGRKVRALRRLFRLWRSFCAASMRQKPVGIALWFEERSQRRKTVLAVEDDGLGSPSYVASAQRGVDGDHERRECGKRNGRRLGDRR